MFPKSLSVIVLSVLVASPLAAQNDKPKSKDAPKPTAHAPVKPAGVKPAGQAVPLGEIQLHVSGLTKDHVTEAEGALNRLTAQRYACPNCKTEAAKAGDCPTCKVPLESKTVALFERVVPDVANGTLALQLRHGEGVRLAQIETALHASGATVDRERLPLGATAALIYKGGLGEDDAKSLQTAFKDAGFGSAHGMFDPDTKEIRVRFPAAPPTWSIARKTGVELTRALQLEDVLWGMPVPPKG